MPKNLFYVGMKVFWTEPDYEIHGTIVTFKCFAMDHLAPISIQWNWRHYSRTYTYGSYGTYPLHIGVIVGKCKKLQKIWEELNEMSNS